MPERANELPYRVRWYRAAVDDTKEYWTAHRTSTTIASPIIVAFLWTIFKPWDWGAVVSVIIIAVLAFAGLWVVVFVGSMIRTPAKLDAAAATAHADELDGISRTHDLALQEKESKIGSVNLELQKQESKTAELEAANRDRANNYHYQQADEALKKLSDNAKAVVRHIYSREKIDTGHTGRVSIAGMTSDATMNILRSDLGGVPFIHASQELDAMSGTKFYWEIVPGYKKALGELLFRPSP